VNIIRHALPRQSGFIEAVEAVCCCWDSSKSLCVLGVSATNSSFSSSSRLEREGISPVPSELQLSLNAAPTASLGERLESSSSGKVSAPPPTLPSSPVRSGSGSGAEGPARAGNRGAGLGGAATGAGTRAAGGGAVAAPASPVGLSCGEFSASTAGDGEVARELSIPSVPGDSWKSSSQSSSRRLRGSWSLRVCGLMTLSNAAIFVCRRVQVP
jgi:hypothetical protein